MSGTKDAARTIVVQKFGGSSLATPELREIAAKRVRDSAASGLTPVVVTSAIGRLPAPYATDSLIALVPDALYASPSFAAPKRSHASGVVKSSADASADTSRSPPRSILTRCLHQVRI